MLQLVEKHHLLSVEVGVAVDGELVEIDLAGLVAVLALLVLEAGSVLLKEENSNRLYFRSAVGGNAAEVKKYTLKPGEGIAGRVADTGEPFLSNDAAGEPDRKSVV